MTEFKVEGHASSLLPEGKHFKLVWADEFDGDTLDESKWAYRTSMMQKVHPAWGTRGVTLDGKSNAVFNIYRNEEGRLVSSQLQTGFNYMDEPLNDAKFDGDLSWKIGKLRKNLFTKKYGYFECRCKLQSHIGWWSAFWLQSPIIGCCDNPKIAGVENDIMESFHPGEMYAHANHYNGYGADHECKTAGEGRKGLDTSVYHTFGMLWERDGYTFYVDGVEDGKIASPVSEQEQFILISTEIIGYRGSEHRATDYAIEAMEQGDCFAVDHIRVFDIADD